MKSLIVNKNYNNKKLSSFLVSCFPRLSINSIFKALRKKDIKLNNIRINTDVIVHTDDNISLYKGIIAENYVANQLVCNGYDLYYWKNNATAEVDFLLYTKEGIIPVEVKAGDSTQSKSLNVYNELYHPKFSIRISTKDFGYNPDTKIKSIPLYATFLL